MNKACAEIETDKVIEVIVNQGAKGNDGLSAYEIAVKQGYEGTEDEWLLSLKGERGEKGDTGEKGEKGKDGLDGKDAKINGMNTLEIVAGKNIEIEQTDTTLKIENTYEYDDTDIKNNIDVLSETIDEHDRDIANIDSALIDLQDGKADRTEIPTKLSQLTNDEDFAKKGEIEDEYAKKSDIPDVSSFVTNATSSLINYYLKSETYTKNEVNSLINAIKTIEIEVVDELPQIGQTNKIYLVPNETQKEKNIYDEYIYVNNAWELIGSTQIDLSNYYTKDEINELLGHYITPSILEQTLNSYVTKNYLETYLNNIKYNYVKDGIVNNTNTLSDEEKLKIETWLGLAENYLTYYNETPYQVNTDYNPTNKKYVDEKDKQLSDKIKEIELAKFPNVTIFGTPNIQQGQISGFTRDDYLEFPFLVDFKNQTFEINFAFTTGGNIDIQQNILDSDFGLAFAIRNKHLVLALSFNGTSWATEQVGTLTLLPQTSYRVRISWNKLLYRVQYSTDGGNTYIDDITFGATQYPYPKQMYIGVGKLADNYFEGIINLNYANVKIADTLIWQGLDDVGLSTRLATDMSNIDNAGVNYINSLIDVKIQGTLGKLDTTLQDIDTGSGGVV